MWSAVPQRVKCRTLSRENPGYLSRENPGSLSRENPGSIRLVGVLKILQFRSPHSPEKSRWLWNEQVCQGVKCKAP